MEIFTPDRYIDPFRKHRLFSSIITFLPIGNAPRLAQSKYNLTDSTSSFIDLFNIVRKALDNKDVHLYVNNQFEPMEDQCIGDIVKLFGKEERNGSPNYSMAVYYSIGRAYV